VETFSAEFRKRFGQTDLLDRIEAAHSKLIALRRETIFIPDLAPSTASGMPFVPVKVLFLMQIALRRASELADAMVRDANSFSYTPVWTNSRSIFELAALLYDSKERIRVILQKWDSKAYYDFCDHLDAILLGFKSTEWHPKSQEHPDLTVITRNILTLIDRITAKHIPHFRSMYDLLSEVAHPNYMGMMEQYMFVHDGLNIEFIDHPVARNSLAIKIPLDNAHSTLEMLALSVAQYDGWFRDFVALCEKHVPPEDAKTTTDGGAP
jgi:hypothetical protein